MLLPYAAPEKAESPAVHASAIQRGLLIHVIAFSDLMKFAMRRFLLPSRGFRCDMLRSLVVNLSLRQS
jgi:hypothetical protein